MASTMSNEQMKEIRHELIQVLESSNGSIEMEKVFGTYDKMFKKQLRVKKYGLSLRGVALINADIMEVIQRGKKGKYLLQLKGNSQTMGGTQTSSYRGNIPTVTSARPPKAKKTPQPKKMFLTQSPKEMLKECLERDLRELLKKQKKKRGLALKALRKEYKAHFCNNLPAMLKQCRIPCTLMAIARAFQDVFVVERTATKNSNGRNKLQLKHRMKALDATVIALPEPSSPGLYAPQIAAPADPEGSRKRALPWADKKSKGKKKLKKSLTENTASNLEDKGFPTEGQLQQQQQQQRCLTQRPHFHSKEDVLAQCFINDIAKANKLVTVHHVMQLLLQHYHVSNVQELGLHRETLLPAVDRLVRLQSKVNAFTQAFVKVRAVCTLYELREYLANVEVYHCRSTGRDFADLGLGPLTKQPLVWEYFRFPESKINTDIPCITTMDVMKELSDWLTECNLWSKRLELKDFMEYLMKKYDVQEPLELGLRISSFPVLITAVKKARKQTHSTMAEVHESLKPQVVTLVKESIAEINKAVMSQATLEGHCFADGPSLEARHRYVNMKASHAVRAVFNNACQIECFSSQLRGLCLSLERVMADPMSCSLLQLAICCGDLSRPDDLPKGIPEKMEENKEEMKENSSNLSEKETEENGSNLSEKESPEESHPTLDQVKQELMCHFDHVQHSALSLRDFAWIERKLCQHFGVPNFQSLGQTKRTFLEFLSTDQPEVLDGVGDGLMDLTTSNPNQGSSYRPSRLDLVEFIRQCGPHKESDQGTINRCLCAHYQVNTVEELGHGPVNRLSQPIIKMAAALGQYQQDSNAVIYETALCAANRRNESKRKEVGSFGSQGVEDALLCLQSAPLLEDLAEWSHWTMVFEPEHGDLKAFLERDLGLALSPPIKIKALEVRPGVLLRLATETSNDLFAAAAKNGDSINTVGHLVSLVVKDGLRKVPLALLNNHMETALNMMGVASDHGSAVGFILECLEAVPLQIGQAVVRQVFLKPLVNALGSEVQSRQLILTSCKTTRQKSRIQSLGLLLGISQWKDSFLEERMPRNMDDQQDLSGDEEEESDVSNFLSLKKTPPAEEVPPQVAEENMSVTNACDETVSIKLEQFDEGDDCSVVQTMRKQKMNGNIPNEEVQELKEMDEKVEEGTIRVAQKIKEEVAQEMLAEVEEEEVSGNDLKGNFVLTREVCSLKEWPPPKQLLWLYSSQPSSQYPPQPKERLSVDGRPQQEAQGGQGSRMEESNLREQEEAHTEQGFRQDASEGDEHHLMTGELQHHGTYQGMEEGYIPL